MRDAVYIVIDALNVLVSLALLAAAIITAVRCGQKKLAPVAGWIMAAGFALGFFCDFGYAVGNLVLSKSAGATSYQFILLAISMINLVGLAAVAAGIGMYSVKPTPAGQEARNG